MGFHRAAANWKFAIQQSGTLRYGRGLGGLCCLVVALLLASARVTPAATNDLTMTLQKALFEEEANHNLGAAIQLYQSVVGQFDKDRKLAATAVFRLAECYRKQGNTNEATAQYERVLGEFADQTQLTGLSRQSLSALGAPAPSGATTLSSAARQEQKRLLEAEVKLVEQKLASQQKQIEAGVISSDDLLSTQRELLQLKRQIAAVDAGGPVAATGANIGAQEAAVAKADAAALETKLERLNQMKPEDLRIAVQQEYPNPLLSSLMQQLAESEQNLAALNKEFGPNHSKVLEETARSKTISGQIDVQVKAVLNGLAAKRQEAEARAASLAQAELAPETKATPAAQAGTSAEAEEVRRIQTMIKDSPDLINAKPENGKAPLNSAASMGHLVVAQFLLEHGADIEVKNPGDGWMPIHYAAYYGHKAIVELLLSHKARVDARTGDERTPLLLAAGKGFRSVVEVLLGNGANINAQAANVTPLHLAVGNGFRSVAELLLAQGADPNVSAPSVYVAQDNMSGTPLHLAVKRGDLAMAELLVSKKADPNTTDGNGKTPLDIAADSGNRAMAEFLLSHGADINARNEDPGAKDWTALHYAVTANQKEMVDLLLKHKADPNVPIQTGYVVGSGPRQFGPPGQPPNQAVGYTPVLLAATKGYADIVESLLAAKADPDRKSERGDSAVMNTMTYLQSPVRGQVLARLLEHGADPNARDASGKTALIAAAELKDKASLELLLAHKADVNAKIPGSGISALHFLVFGISSAGPVQDVPAMTKDLIAAGADVNPQDGNGRTPLQYLKQQLASSMRGINEAVAREITDLLRQAGAAEDLARMDVIEVRRPSANYSSAVFWKGTNDYNYFTLFEVVAAHYGFISPKSAPSPNVPQFDPGSRTLASNLQFPDLAHVSIRRPKPDRTEWISMSIDLSGILRSASAAGNCAGDERLQWGDVVEIPEADHPISAVWQGLPREQLAVFERCLSRKVNLTVKGSTTNLVLSPNILPLGARPPQFTLVPVLYQSGMLRASSDLSRVKVTRRDAVSGQSFTLSFDCSPSLPPDRLPALWLRDGDAIEVPDRP